MVHAAYSLNAFRSCIQILKVLGIAIIMGLSSCASRSDVRQEDSSPSTSIPESSDVATVTPQGTETSANLSAEERAARSALEQEGMIVYFEYDSSRILEQYQPLLASHARYATRFRSVQVRLEGHTDERGAREYNVGLGERRAQAVRRALEIQGVAADQIRTVSYGEERPAADGSGEESWSRNRRVEIRYSP